MRGEKMKKMLIAAICAGASLSSFAQTAPESEQLLYGELGYTGVEIERGGSSADNELLTGFIGYKFHPNVAGEAFLAVGVGDETQDVFGTPITTELDSMYGLFIKPTTMVSDQLELFGRVGYVAADLTVSSPTGSFSEDDSSFAYGAGANYYFTDRFYGQFAYTTFYDKDDTDISGYTLAVGMEF
jgi:hypothetical protein